MADYYYFFFSYARDNYSNARWERYGEAGNYLHGFFDQISREVSDLSGVPSAEVGYMDQERLRLADFWDSQLIDSLQSSRVLLAILSPHYFQSENCGREFEFFRKKLEAYKRDLGKASSTHRIIPIFWEDMQFCFKNISIDIARVITDLNMHQAGMPENYPRVKGAKQICKLQIEDMSKLCRQIAERIVELAQMEPIPDLQFSGDFREILSAFHSKERVSEYTSLVDGINSINIVYVVGTKREMADAGYECLDIYDDNRGSWLPFVHSLGATIEMATQEGVKIAGQTEYRNLGLPDDLLNMLNEAEKQENLVLLVLDRNALKVPRILEVMKQYDRVNYKNIALVTAGGNDVEIHHVEEVFEYKFNILNSHHIWTTPLDRDSYVSCVANQIISLKQSIRSRQLRTKAPEFNLPARRKPTLRSHEGG